MRMLIVMRDEDGLMLLPLHVAEKFFSSLNHVLARGVVVGRPVEAQMLDRIFRRTATGPDAGLLLEQLGVAGSPEHFVYGGGDMIVREIKCVGPGYALLSLFLGIVGQVGGKSAKGFA